MSAETVDKRFAALTHIWDREDARPLGLPVPPAQTISPERANELQRRHLCACIREIHDVPSAGNRIPLAELAETSGFSMVQIRSLLPDCCDLDYCWVTMESLGR